MIIVPNTSMVFCSFLANSPEEGRIQQPWLLLPWASVQTKPQDFSTRGGVVSVIAFYEKVVKVKADVAAYLINCFPSA